ncbi:MAG: transglutaminase family protein [Bacteroidales bacterium]|jgi:regulator of sirC expression with transglutaminase-like and TPR domain|nr:transglutaminase family protein [Bacteroidales bacterium]
MRPDTELISLISLMDDPDFVIRNAVRDRLVERGEEALEQIERYCIHDFPVAKRESYLDFIDDVKRDIAFEKLSSLLESPQPLLERGLFLVTKIADTSCEETIYYSTIENLAEDISLEIAGEKTPVERVKIFNYLFFRRFRFHHADAKIESLEGALADRVLLSRGGNPVTISLLYFLLSRSAGLPVYPLCFTGGFVPVYLDNDGKILFYLNIFKQGSIFLEETLVQFFDDIGMKYEPESLKIEQERALVAIYTELLGFIYKNKGNTKIYERIERVTELFGGRRYL